MSDHVVGVPLQSDGSLPVTIVGGSSSGTQYTEDAAAAADPVGTVPILVRKDTPAATVTTDGDNIAQRGTNYGAAYVQVVNSSGSFVDTFGGGTQYTEDAVAPADPVGNSFMVTRDDQLSAVTEAEGDWSRLRGTAKGALWVALADSSGDPITSFGGGTQYTEDVAAAADPTGTAFILVRADSLAAVTTTDGDNIAARATNKGEQYVKHVDTIAVTQSGSWTADTELPAAAALGDSDANPTAPAVGSFGMYWTGAAWKRLFGDANGLQLQGAVSHDSTNVQNTKPFATGGRASAAAPADVSADNDAVTGWFLRNGAQATVLTAAGALIGGDASNGLDVDVTRVTGTVTIAGAVTNSGTFATQIDGSALTALQLIDDPVATLGTTTYTETTTKGMIIGAVRRDADTTLVDTTNEVAPLQVNAGGQLKVAVIAALPAGSAAIGKLAANDGVDIGDVTINNASGGSAVNIQDGGNSITVDGTVAATNTALSDFGAGEYETVAASQTAQVLGATGGAGDYISGVLIIPATTSPGNVLLLDNATSITIFTGGASSVSNLVPFLVPLGIKSVSGAWKLTTGANVSCIGMGNFT